MVSRLVRKKEESEEAKKEEVKQDDTKSKDARGGRKQVCAFDCVSCVESSLLCRPFPLIERRTLIFKSIHKKDIQHDRRDNVSHAVYFF